MVVLPKPLVLVTIFATDTILVVILCYVPLLCNKFFDMERPKPVPYTRRLLDIMSKV